jgi:hypothetical protein
MALQNTNTNDDHLFNNITNKNKNLKSQKENKAFKGR